MALVPDIWQGGRHCLSQAAQKWKKTREGRSPWNIVSLKGGKSGSRLITDDEGREYKRRGASFVGHGKSNKLLCRHLCPEASWKKTYPRLIKKENFYTSCLHLPHEFTDTDLLISVKKICGSGMDRAVMNPVTNSCIWLCTDMIHLAVRARAGSEIFSSTFRQNS